MNPLKYIQRRPPLKQQLFLTGECYEKQNVAPFIVLSLPTPPQNFFTLLLLQEKCNPLPLLQIEISLDLFIYFDQIMTYLTEI